MNEHSYSNAEIFPYAVRARNLAKLVGMPTPGYVIWTDGLRLVDGTSARMPQSGSYRLDGTTQENNGERPDVLVPMTPDDWVAGRDPQLDKAIEMLAARSDKQPDSKQEKQDLDPELTGRAQRESHAHCRQARGRGLRADERCPASQSTHRGRRCLPRHTPQPGTRSSPAGSPQ